MGKKLQRGFEAIVAELPRRFARDLFREKLVEAGLEPKGELVEQLVAHAFSGGKEEITWDAGGEGDFTLTITDEDLKSLDKKVRAFIRDQLPDLVSI